MYNNFEKDMAKEIPGRPKRQLPLNPPPKQIAEQSKPIFIPYKAELNSESNKSKVIDMTDEVNRIMNKLNTKEQNFDKIIETQI